MISCEIWRRSVTVCIDRGLPLGFQQNDSTDVIVRQWSDTAYLKACDELLQLLKAVIWQKEKNLDLYIVFQC